MLALLYSRPDVAQRVSEFLSPQQRQPAVLATAQPGMQLNVAAPEAVEIANSEDKAIGRNTRQQKYVTDWLSRRYRVAGDAANMLVSTAYNTAHEMKLDPLLILAVMAIESGLNPFAESPMGAQGLMQVMSKVHSDKFEDMGGKQAALNPVANIRVGAQILKDYVTRTGSVEAGLKSYVGAGDAADDGGYGSKVLAEYRRLKQVSAGKNVPIFTAPSPAPAPAATAVAQKQAAPAAQPAQPAQPAEAATTNTSTTIDSAHGASQAGETVAGL